MRRRPVSSAKLAPLLWLGLAGPASAGLLVRPLVPMIEAPPGSSVVVSALVENDTAETMYLGTISTDLPPGFTGNDPFSEFVATAPDSLLPGESWEGPVLHLAVAPDAPVADVRQVTLHLSGGLHANDDQPLAAFTFALNDTTVLLSAPDTGAPRAPSLRLSASPNPTRGSSHVAFDLATPQEIDVTVHDVGGAVVRTLARGRRDAGRQSLVWDGRTTAGEPAAPGIYFIRVAGRDGMRHTKVVRVQ